MLRELLEAIAQSPTSSGLELRTRLNLSREAYDHGLATLLRLGYVVSQPLEVGTSACPPTHCQGCPVACQSTPTLGPQLLTLTEHGRRFLAKRPG